MMVTSYPASVKKTADVRPVTPAPKTTTWPFDDIGKVAKSPSSVLFDG